VVDLLPIEADGGLDKNWNPRVCFGARSVVLACPGQTLTLLGRLLFIQIHEKSFRVT
jgi:hypothetical protein